MECEVEGAEEEEEVDVGSGEAGGDHGMMPATK